MKDELSPRGYFWPYDIFGYLVPGAVFLGATLLAWPKSREFVTLDPVWAAIAFLTIAYILGHVIAALSSTLFERTIVKWLLGYPTERQFSDSWVPKTWFGKWLDKSKLGKWALHAVNFLLFGYFDPYSAAFQARFREIFTRTFSVPFPPREGNRSRSGPGESDQRDLFWLVWSHIATHNPVAFRRATHFLELYGFARNLSLSFLALAVGPLLIPVWSFGSEALWVTSCLAVAGTLFISYTKMFYRAHNEIYRAFVAGNLTPAPAAAATAVRNGPG